MGTAKNKKVLQKFGRHVAAIRSSKNMSQRDVAYNCDLDYSKINKIENDCRNITFFTILEVAKGLEVHPRELFDFDFE